MRRKLLLMFLVVAAGALVYRTYRLVDTGPEVETALLEQIPRSRPTYARVADLLRQDASVGLIALKLPSQLPRPADAPLDYPDGMPRDLQVALSRNPLGFDQDTVLRLAEYFEATLTAPYRENYVERVRLFGVLRKLPPSERPRFKGLLLRNLELPREPGAEGEWMDLQRAALGALGELTSDSLEKQSYWEQYRATLPEDISEHPESLQDLHSSYWNPN